MESDARNLLIAAIVRTAAGERTGLQTIYRLTSAKLFGVCLRILRERAEAEDILQEVYLTVWRKATDFDPARARPMTWLITIARNRAIDRLRAKGIRRTEPMEAAAEVADAAPSAQIVLESSEENAKLQGCVNGLAEREQTALRGAYFEGNTYEEMAERMKMPLGTMKSMMRRALSKLKACLEQ